jgi:trehalose 6-phosphate phosphatase
MEYLFEHSLAVASQMRLAGHILLLSDYDGTLTPIVERPELAVMPERNRSLLVQLAHQSGLTVGIISGRALSDLMTRVGINGLVYAGNHGLEIRAPGLRFVNPVADELRPLLGVVHHVLNRTFGTLKGVFVEHKGLSLSVHYRLAEVPRERIRETVQRVVGSMPAGDRTLVTEGKKVIEIRPAVGWDKGRAVRLLMKRYGKGGRRSGLLPIYLGDDRTDEDAFKVIAAYGRGISVLVGDPDGASTARYFVRTPEEVSTFLEMVAHLFERPLGEAARRIDGALAGSARRHAGHLPV